MLLCILLFSYTTWLKKTSSMGLFQSPDFSAAKSKGGLKRKMPALHIMFNFFRLGASLNHLLPSHSPTPSSEHHPHVRGLLPDLTGQKYFTFHGRTGFNRVSFVIKRTVSHRVTRNWIIELFSRQLLGAYWCSCDPLHLQIHGFCKNRNSISLVLTDNVAKASLAAGHSLFLSQNGHLCENILS
jgi:hypothetical protein